MPARTGEEYITGLRERAAEVYIGGEQVKDVTTHPAFRNPARMLARLYDALHEPAMHAALTCPTDTGSGGYTHKYFRAPRSADDLIAALRPTFSQSLRASSMGSNADPDVWYVSIVNSSGRPSGSVRNPSAPLLNPSSSSKPTIQRALEPDPGPALQMAPFSLLAAQVN